MALQLEEYAVAPGTPPTNIVVFYAKSDGRFYGKDDTGTEFALTVSFPIAVNQGGTGATTAANARTNLGAAASGANSDITSLSGLTTPLSIPQGGTGQITANAAFAALSPMTTNGDLTTRVAGVPARLAIGTAGQVLTTVGGLPAWSTPATGADPLGVLDEKDDFSAASASTGQIGKLGWLENSAGTAAATVIKDGVSGHPGIVTVRPGTVATGRAAISLGGAGFGMMLLANGSTELTWIVRSAQTLSAFEMLVVGLGDLANNVGDQTNGVYFQLLGSPTPDTNWHFVTASGGTRTRVDTGIAYAANTWFKLKLTVNAAATSAQANINGVDVGTAITTNIPTIAVSPLVKVDGIAGGTASDTDIDFCRIVKTLTTSR